MSNRHDSTTGRVLCLAAAIFVALGTFAFSASSPAGANNSPGELNLPLTFPINGNAGFRLIPGSGHDGYDLFGTGGIGSPVFASYSGIITFFDASASANWNGGGLGYGRVVYISHGSSRETRYAHLNSYATISVNAVVTTGQQIGFEGVSGGSNNVAHVHFEIRNPATGIWVDINSQYPPGTDTTQVPVTAQAPIGFNGTFLLRSSIANAATARTAIFGTYGDLPIVGDWNSDGYDDIGIVRWNPASGHLDWFLSFTHLNNAANNCLSGTALCLATSSVIGSYGDAGDTPIVGNWNGAVGDEIGVVRRSGGTSFWYLQGAAAGFPFAWGNNNDTPVRGDWDANGVETPGVARVEGGSLRWYIDNQFGTAHEFTFLWGNGYSSPTGVHIDRPMSARWTTTPFAGRPALSRDAADKWFFESSLNGSTGSSFVWATPNSFSNYALVADWDVDVEDEFITAV